MVGRGAPSRPGLGYAFPLRRAWNRARAVEGWSGRGDAVRPGQGQPNSMPPSLCRGRGRTGAGAAAGRRRVQASGWRSQAGRARSNDRATSRPRSSRSIRVILHHDARLVERDQAQANPGGVAHGDDAGLAAARGRGRHAGQELTGSGNNHSREVDRRSSTAKFRKDHVFIRSSLVCCRRGLT